MNDIYSTKVKMFMRVKNVFTSNEEAWNSIPAFSNSYNSFSSHLGKIDEINTLLQNTSRSTTEVKNEQKRTMVDLTMVLVGALKAYTNVSKTIALTEVSATTKSSIMKAKETDADNICMNILNKAKGVLPELASFGITQTEIDDTEAAINSFAEMVGKPKTHILLNKSYNQQISSLIKTADNILNEELDGLMIRFKTTKETFYNEYNSAKRIGGGAGKKEGDND